MRRFSFLFWVGLGIAGAGPARAQLAYRGPAGGVLLQTARQQQTAGDRAGAAASYQQAYQAFASVDDSDGMSAALAGRKATASAGASPRPAAAAPAPQAGKTAPRPAAQAPPAGPAPQAGRMEGNKPIGLFFVTKSLMGSYSTLSYYFAPDGIAYENPPGLSAAELAAAPPRNKGRYSVAGKTLSIAWGGSPKPESLEMEKMIGGFGWTQGSIFSPVGPFRSPSQLVGTFEGGASVYSAVGGAVVSKSLTFRADGTYTADGAATVTSVTERSVAETGGASSKSGRWRLTGWYLTLTDAHGHTVRDVAYPVGPDAQVALFNFNGTAYTRH